MQKLQYYYRRCRTTPTKTEIHHCTKAFIESSTVMLIMKRFKELEPSLDDLKRMEPVKVEKAFYPPENLRHQDIPLPDFEAIHDRMIAMGKNADLGFLWLEYKEHHPDGYQRSQFYHLYR